MLRQLISIALNGVFKRNESQANKDNAEKSLQLAQAALLNGDTRDAILHYESYLESHPYRC